MRASTPPRRGGCGDRAAQRLAERLGGIAARHAAGLVRIEQEDPRPGQRRVQFHAAALVKLEELPLAFADRTVRCSAFGVIMRVVKEDSVAAGGLGCAGQNRA